MNLVEAKHLLDELHKEYSEPISNLDLDATITCISVGTDEKGKTAIFINVERNPIIRFLPYTFMGYPINVQLEPNTYF